MVIWVKSAYFWNTVLSCRLLGGSLLMFFPSKIDISGIRSLETTQNPKQCGLAAAAWTEQCQKFHFHGYKDLSDPKVTLSSKGFCDIHNIDQLIRHLSPPGKSF